MRIKQFTYKKGGKEASKGDHNFSTATVNTGRQWGNICKFHEDRK